MSDYDELLARLDQYQQTDSAAAIRALIRERDEAERWCSNKEECLARALKAEARVMELEDAKLQQEDETTVKLHARVMELERLIRFRCEGWLCVNHKPYKRHAPECLVEEAGLPQEPPRLA